MTTREDADVPGTVVVGFTDTVEGQAALSAAIDEARRRDARIILVSSQKGGHEDAGDVRAIEAGLAAATAGVSAEGIAFEVAHFARGNDPATDVLNVANAEQADLIVIGLRRRSPVGKLLLGSNSQQVLLGADCAVLAVKPAT